MDYWKSLISNRKQTTSWDMSRDVDSSILEDIMQEVHERSPSKQNISQYEIHIFDWSDLEFRNHFNEFTVKDPNSEHRLYNTQTLAPYLIILTRRKDAPWDRYNAVIKQDFLVDLYNKYTLSSMEIGFAAMNIMLSAAHKGLDTGLCACVDWDYEHIEYIMSRLEITDIKDIYLSIGVGYGSSDKKTLNTYNNELVYANVNDGKMWKIEPKPNIESYIKFK